MHVFRAGRLRWKEGRRGLLTGVQAEGKSEVGGWVFLELVCC